jgi:hypothetical protein
MLAGHAEDAPGCSQSWDRLLRRPAGRLSRSTALLRRPGGCLMMSAARPRFRRGVHGRVDAQHIYVISGAVRPLTPPAAAVEIRFSGRGISAWSSPCSESAETDKSR